MELKLRSYEIPPHLSKYFRPKTLAVGNNLLIPHRVAIGLQSAGWIVRQDVVWSKRSPMPESIAGWQWKRCRVKLRASMRAYMEKKSETTNGRPHGGRASNGRDFDSSAKWIECPGCPKCEANGGWVLRRGAWRNTTAHECILQVVKSARYFCDGVAAAEAAIGGVPGNVNHKAKAAYEAGDKHHRRSAGLCEVGASETRNPRSVWSLSSEGYKKAHFATFPTELVRRCLVASCSKHGCCPTCGSQYAPMITTERVPTRTGENSKVNRASDDADSPYHGQNGMVVGNRDPKRNIKRTIVHGYRQTCNCPPAEAARPVVLDPFSGSGTTIQVATHMGFDAIGFELNPAYIELAKERIAKVPRCLIPKAERKKKPKPVHPSQKMLELF